MSRPPVPSRPPPARPTGATTTTSARPPNQAATPQRTTATTQAATPQRTTAPTAQRTTAQQGNQATPQRTGAQGQQQQQPNAWLPYVDNMVKSQKISQGAIVGHNGGTWAASPGLTITPDEAKALVASFKDAAPLREKGIFLSGTKYMFLRGDDRSVYGKKGAVGCVCVKTGKSVIIGIYPEGVQPGDAVVTVEKMADYLIEKNY